LVEALLKDDLTSSEHSLSHRKLEWDKKSENYKYLQIDQRQFGSMAPPWEAGKANKINGLRNRFGEKWLHCLATFFKSIAPKQSRSFDRS
jgi:hypothetical protein